MKLYKLSLIGIVVFLIGCSGSDDSTSKKESGESTTLAADDPRNNKGIGPISKIRLDPEIDQELAAIGKEAYDLKCSACHKTHEKFIGPPPVGIFDRRSPEWIMNMILNPEEMIAKDPIAIKLLAEYNFAPMANQNLTEEEARAILEYFRTIE